MMFRNKLILSVVAAAICVNVAAPAYAGYQTVYTPANHVYVGGANGQTIIIKDTTPTQTIVVRENVPQTIVVNETPTYYPQTAYVSSESLIAAGVTGLVGGVLLGTIFDKPHHNHKSHVAPPSKGHDRGHNPPHGGNHKNKPHKGR